MQEEVVASFKAVFQHSPVGAKEDHESFNEDNFTTEVLTEYIWIANNKYYHFVFDRDSLCVLVVRGPGYRSRYPNSIPGSTRFSGK
jgi:hypothetical protein